MTIQFLGQTFNIQDDLSLANSKFLGKKISLQMRKTNTSGIKALLCGTNKSSSHFLNVFPISAEKMVEKK